MKKDEIMEEFLDDLSSIISEYLPQLNKRNFDKKIETTFSDGSGHIMKLKYDTSTSTLTVKYQPKMD
ncbi:hypothetical protein ACUH7Y_09480 [Clostridium beijerinckii]|uniref:Uncharacterized protein n=1 Tax=Clostridium beijerinckii TaxID=1520 RepID=A0A7X9SMW2_CLOBE|nr:hypothetical protein [Clostridium beijerinckii]NMF04543.1 hypothetical protein [Clostridium beijerinckii]